MLSQKIHCPCQLDQLQDIAKIQDHLAMPLGDKLSNVPLSSTVLGKVRFVPAVIQDGDPKVRQ